MGRNIGTLNKAAKDRTDEQADLAAFNKPPGRRPGGRGGPGRPGPGGGPRGRPAPGTTGAGATPSPGLGGGTATGPAKPGNYNTGGAIYNSPEWYSQNQNQLGVQSAANDPYFFWSSYGDKARGWQPGGNQTGFFRSTFDPQAMAGAMFTGANSLSSNDEFLAAQTSIANALSGGGAAALIDPAALVGNVMKALTSGDPNKLNQLLQAVGVGNPSDPQNVLNTASGLIQFLGSALQGSMPADVLKGFMGMLERMADQFYSQATGRGVNLDSQNFARFLTSKLGGATLGL